MLPIEEKHPQSIMLLSENFLKNNKKSILRTFSWLFIWAVAFFATYMHKSTVNEKVHPNIYLAHDVLLHLCATLMVAGLVHLVDIIYLRQESVEEFKSSINRILEDALKTSTEQSREDLHAATEQSRKDLHAALAENISIVGQADKIGLVGLYLSRNEVIDEVKRAIENAKGRVWLVGVAFHENLKLEELLRILNRASSNVDIKVLMLDALCDAGVFRTMLENSKDELRSMLESVKKIEPDEETSMRTIARNEYKELTLCNSFKEGVRALRKYPSLRDRVRFYKHTPVCWMAVIDDVIYYQPYTFGRHMKDINDVMSTVGDKLPVFKFVKNDQPSTFDVLIDHFLKLWITTDQDLNYIEKRSDIICYQNMFQPKRVVWLESIFGDFYEGENMGYHPVDRRELPRRACELKPSPVLGVHLGKELVCLASIVNQTRQGLCLMLEDAQHSEKPEIKKNDEIILLNLTDYSAKEKGSSTHEEIVKEYLGDSGCFSVIDCKPNRIIHVKKA